MRDSNRDATRERLASTVMKADRAMPAAALVHITTYIEILLGMDYEELENCFRDSNTARNVRGNNADRSGAGPTRICYGRW
jgi:hypothetical protein